MGVSAVRSRDFSFGKTEQNRTDNHTLAYPVSAVGVGMASSRSTSLGYLRREWKHVVESLVLPMCQKNPSRIQHVQEPIFFRHLPGCDFWHLRVLFVSAFFPPLFARSADISTQTRAALVSSTRPGKIYVAVRHK